MSRPILKVKKKPHRLAKMKAKGSGWVTKNTPALYQPPVVVEVDYSTYSELESLLLSKNYNASTDIIVLPEEFDLKGGIELSKTEIFSNLGPILYMKVKHPALVTTRHSFTPVYKTGPRVY